MMLAFPETDPTPIVEHFRGIYATELLTAAVVHFKVFEHLAARPLSDDELRTRLGLAERPFIVLTIALRAMGLLARDPRLNLTPLAREHLVAEAPFSITSYLGLAGENPSVLNMVERLRTNRPAAPLGEGTAFIYRAGVDSAMEKEYPARQLTLSLAGRARNVAPYLAERLSLADARLLLDVGGGTGIYSYALLRKHPHLKAIVLDRPEVIKVAREIAHEWRVAERVEFIADDMFGCDYPKDVDVVLLSNVLHDWDVPECRELIDRAAKALANGGQLVIHDVFLNDELDGPLPVALYSAALFTLTEGRAYSAAEYRQWLQAVGFTTEPVVPTFVHCGYLRAIRGVAP